MSPAPRKKKDEEAPTAAEVEAKASEEAGEVRAEGRRQARGREEAEAAEVEETVAADKPKAPAKKRAKKSASKRPTRPPPPTTGRPRRTKPKKKPAAKKKAEAEDKPKTPARKRDQPRAGASRRGARSLVRAQARYVRTSARKARLVCDHIRGKDVEQARAILSFTPRGAAKPWLKLLESAIANAEHNHELVGDELKIASIHADEGPTLKRYRPRAMGRATRIRKRTSHLTITLTPKE